MNKKHLKIERLVNTLSFKLYNTLSIEGVDVDSAFLYVIRGGFSERKFSAALKNNNTIKKLVHKIAKFDREDIESAFYNIISSFDYDDRTNVINENVLILIKTEIMRHKASVLMGSYMKSKSTLMPIPKLVLRDSSGTTNALMHMILWRRNEECKG